MYNRIDLPLAPSALTGLLAAAPWVVLAALAFSLAAVGHWWLIPVPVLLLLTALSGWRRNGALSAPDAIVRLTTRGPRLLAELAAGDEEEVIPTGDSRVSGRYLVLGLRGASSRRRYLLVLLAAPRGNAPAEPLRRLRVWLRLMPAPLTFGTRPWYTRFLPSLLHPVRSGDKPHEYRSQSSRPPSP